MPKPNALNNVRSSCALRACVSFPPLGEVQAYTYTLHLYVNGATRAAQYTSLSTRAPVVSA